MILEGVDEPAGLRIKVIEWSFEPGKPELALHLDTPSSKYSILAEGLAVTPRVI